MPGKLALGERQTDASMMEQLVPEITIYMLSFLDYLSLCRLSMTNSVMRKAANDDNAWKVLYYKDFPLEDNNITPVNGWKAYYEVTKAILTANTEFFNIIRDRSLEAMGRLWLNADHVQCIHNSGESYSGYNAVMESWELAFFNWEGVHFEVQERCIRVGRDVAWVTMKTSVNNAAGAMLFRCNQINIFELSNGGWHLVYHQCAPFNEGHYHNVWKKRKYTYSSLKDAVYIDFVLQRFCTSIRSPIFPGGPRHMRLLQFRHSPLVSRP